VVFVRHSKFMFSVIVFHQVIIKWLVLNFSHHHPNHSTQFLNHSSCALCHSHLQFSPSTVSGH
jgi:hypothetical protein